MFLLHVVILTHNVVRHAVTDNCTHSVHSTVLMVTVQEFCGSAATDGSIEGVVCKTHDLGGRSVQQGPILFDTGQRQS